MKKIFLLFFTILLVAAGELFLKGCKKDPIVITNPYDDVNYDTDTTSFPEPDSISITGLHRDIFMTRCAMPGCHDGNFEPDYRTVQSAYSTLVYQPVNKFTVDFVHYFKYRVIPYDTTNSFLHERISTTSQDFMPPAGSGRLTEAEIKRINLWILNGARDQYGNVPTRPDNPPQITYFLAADSALMQLDTNRVGGVISNPFIVKQGMSVTVIPFVTDDYDSLSTLTINTLKLSTNRDDFSSAASFTAIYIPIYKVWAATFPANYPKGTTVYMRYYVKDSAHTKPTEFPRNDSPFYYKTYYSFYVQ